MMGMHGLAENCVRVNAQRVEEGRGGLGISGWWIDIFVADWTNSPRAPVVLKSSEYKSQVFRY